jgi:hypothetical protein
MRFSHHLVLLYATDGTENYVSRHVIYTRLTSEQLKLDVQKYTRIYQNAMAVLHVLIIKWQ